MNEDMRRNHCILHYILGALCVSITLSGIILSSSCAEVVTRTHSASFTIYDPEYADVCRLIYRQTQKLPSSTRYENWPAALAKNNIKLPDWRPISAADNYAIIEHFALLSLVHERDGGLANAITDLTREIDDGDARLYEVEMYFGSSNFPYKVYGLWEKHFSLGPINRPQIVGDNSGHSWKNLIASPVDERLIGIGYPDSGFLEFILISDHPYILSTIDGHVFVYVGTPGIVTDSDLYQICKIEKDTGGLKSH